MIARDWTKGSILRNVLVLAWPVMIGSSLNMLGPTIDMIWVGRLGAASIAGVGVAGMLVMLVDSLKMGISTGLRAIVARFVGAGDYEGATHAGQQSFVISAAYSIVMATIGILFAKPLLMLMGLEPDVISAGAAYMRIMFVCRVFMSLWLMCEAMMQASGDTVTPMKISVIFRLFHIVLCPFLVFGWWLFPRLGVSGAAMANTISESVAVTLGLWFLLTGRTRLRLSFKGFRFDLNMIWRIVRIGIPASISSVERSFGQTVMMKILAPFGTLAVAAHTICQRVDMALSVPASGTGMAAGVLAGQNLGAKQPERAARSVWLAAGIGEGLMATLSLVLLLSPQTVARIFGSEPELIKVASTFLRIMVVYFLAEGARMVFNQSLNSVGDTVTTMLVALISMWMVQVPLAYFLRITGLGVLGVRWAMVTATIAQTLTYVIYFRIGRWKRKKV